jgi:hypothetical protein
MTKAGLTKMLCIVLTLEPLVVFDEGSVQMLSQISVRGRRTKAKAASLN